MALTPEKDARNAAPVPPVAADARPVSGVEHFVNPMSAAPLLAAPVAMMAVSAAIGLGMMKQFAGLMLGAFDGALLSVEKAATALEQDTLNIPEPKVAVGPALRIVVDNPTIASPASAKPAAQPPVTSETVTKPAKAKAVKTASDDLKRISGIGPKLEKMLQDKGLKRFSDVAKLSAAKAAALDSELGLGGRILRDQWVAQAKALSKEQA